MKIYQIHEYGGDWEDYRDHIVGTYLLKDKAIKEKERFEKEEEIRQKCYYCPLYYCDIDCDNDCEECIKTQVDRAKIYCNRYEPFDDIKCVNCCHNFTDLNYRIEEVEVVE